MNTGVAIFLTIIIILIILGIVGFLIWWFMIRGKIPSCAKEGEIYDATIKCCEGLIDGPNRRCIASPTPPGPPGPSPPNTVARYKIVSGMNLSGKDIFDSIGTKFTFFTAPDPTHGYVNYGAHTDLLQVVDSTKLRINIGNNRGQPRNSIRLSSSTTFDSGLLVVDVEKVPHDFSTWPAFWTLGDVDTPNSWALSGEIDIVEQVNNSNFNSVTLHTSTPPGGAPCKMDSTFGDKSNCFATGGDKTCGFQSTDFCPYIGCGKNMGPNTFGSVFNERQGGTFAMELTKEGQITVWFWARGEMVPNFATVISSNFTVADPKNIIRFSPCPGQFKRQRIIINTTLCGDWAGNAGCCPGNPQWTNDAGCRTYVNSADLSNSYWVIRSLQLYTIN